MIDLLEKALEASRSGEIVALATIVRAQGSTPRAVGTKMIVFKDGSFRGTIGGGEMERRVIEAAKTALLNRQPALLHYNFQEVEAGDPGICGGENDVFIDLIAPPMEMVIAGAGHVGQAVAELGAFLGLECIVIDSREEWANAERFPRARKILVGSIAEELQKHPIGLRSYVVIATRGHLEDGEALAAVLRSPAAYIGMIGSRRKKLRIFEMMRAQGFEEHLLERVSAPIGLDIGAETPEEIAVSIIAEVVKVIHCAP